MEEQPEQLGRPNGPVQKVLSPLKESWGTPWRKDKYWPWDGPLGRPQCWDRREPPVEGHRGRHKQQGPQNCHKKDQLLGRNRNDPPQTGDWGEGKTEKS
jgi:hypothetical protein